MPEYVVTRIQTWRLRNMGDVGGFVEDTFVDAAEALESIRRDSWMDSDTDEWQVEEIKGDDE